jgi:hypothetical protein
MQSTTELRRGNSKGAKTNSLKEINPIQKKKSIIMQGTKSVATWL